MTRPTIAWSYSALNTFENCPRKFWATKIAKKVNDFNKFNARGDSEHDHFEHYLKSGIKLPQPLVQYTPMLDKLKAAPGQLYVEFKMTLDANFVPCRFNDWDRAWVRGAADAVVVNGDKATYFDWKSGKYRASEDQIELTSLLVFKHFPEVQTVKGGLVFYNAGRMFPHVVPRQQEPLLWNSYISRVKELEQAKVNDEWPATPNPLCGWCPYGACPHNTNENAQR